MKIHNQKDFWSGVMFIAIGILFMIWSREYQFGTASRMGPGYFPMVLGGMQIALGILVALPSIKPSGPIVKVAPFGWRGILVVLGAVALYSLLLPHLGFVLSMVLLVVISATATREFKLTETLISMVVLGFLSYFTFVKGLELQFPVWPPMFTK